MEREALKLALEALGKAKRQIVHAKVAPHGCIGDAITAIKEALEQPAQEQEPVREALKLALEALLNSVDLVVEDAYNAEQLYGSYPTRQARIGGLKGLADKHREAIAAAEAALAQPEQEQNFCPRCGKRTKDIHTCTPPQENT